MKNFHQLVPLKIWENHNNYEGGSVKNFINKHRSDFQGILDHSLNLAGGGLYSGGSIHVGGGVHVGGGLHYGTYHKILNMKPAHWEATREAAAQILGAIPSPMWPKIKANPVLRSTAENYEHILKMPSVHAAARMLDAEHSVLSGSGFQNAVDHSIKEAGLFDPSNEMNNESNSELSSKITAVSNHLNNIASSLSEIDSGQSTEESLKHVKQAIQDVVAEELPNLINAMNQLLGRQ